MKKILTNSAVVIICENPNLIVNSNIGIKIMDKNSSLDLVLQGTFTESIIAREIMRKYDEIRPNRDEWVIDK